MKAEDLWDSWVLDFQAGLLSRSLLKTHGPDPTPRVPDSEVS